MDKHFPFLASWIQTSAPNLTPPHFVLKRGIKRRGHAGTHYIYKHFFSEKIQNKELVWKIFFENHFSPK